MTAIAVRPTAMPAPADAGRFLLVLLHLAGVYLAVPLRAPGGFEFPVATMLVTTPLLLAINLPRIRERHLYPLMGLVGVALLTVVLAPDAGQYLSARLKGAVLWTWSIVSAYALVLEVSRWGRADVARLMGLFVAAILLGCLLENYAGLRSVSNVFRRLVFVSARFEWVSRDIEIVGVLRPRLFTAEPSDVAKFYALAAFGWIALSASRYRHAVGLLLTMAGMWLIRSPIVLLIAPLQVLLLVLGRPLAAAVAPLSRPIKVSGFAVALALGGALAAWLLVARVQAVLAGAEPSAVIRLAAPVLVAWQTLAASPVWGAGISGTEAIADIIVSAYSLIGLEKFADPTITGEHMTVANLVSNAFWLHWINFGLLGGVLVLWLLAQWMVALGVRRRLLAFLVIFGFAQTMGAVHGPYFWTYLAVILLVALHLDQFGPLRLRFVAATVERP